MNSPTQYDCASVCGAVQITSAKIALADELWTYEPSYNFIKKAPSLAISRPMHGGKYKFGWNLKTDDLALEYTYKALKVGCQGSSCLLLVL